MGGKGGESKGAVTKSDNIGETQRTPRRTLPSRMDGNCGESRGAATNVFDYVGEATQKCKWKTKTAT